MTVFVGAKSINSKTFGLNMKKKHSKGDDWVYDDGNFVASMTIQNVIETTDGTITLISFDGKSFDTPSWWENQGWEQHNVK